MKFLPKVLLSMSSIFLDRRCTGLLSVQLFRKSVCLLALMVMFRGLSLAAQEPEIRRPEYFHIKDLNFAVEKQLPRTMILSGRSLRETLLKIVENEKWSYWIDPEIDGTHQVELQALQSTTSEALQKLAEKTGVGILRIDTIVYVSSPENTPVVVTTAALRKLELHAQLIHWPAHRQQAWKSRHSLAWDDLTSMSELIEKAEQLWDVRIEGEIPHDLLPAGHLTNVLLADVLSVIAANSNQTFDVSSSGESCRFRPLQPDDLTIRVQFPEVPQDRLLKLATDLPHIKIVNQKPLVIVTGTEPDLRQLYWLTRGKSESSTTASQPKDSPPFHGLTTAVEPGISQGKKSSKKKTPENPTGLNPAKLKITLKPTQTTRLAVLEQLSQSGMVIEYSEKDFIVQGLPLDQKIDVVAENMALDEFVKSLFPAGKVRLQVAAGKLILSPVVAQP